MDSGGCCYGLWSRPHDYTHHIGDVAGSAMRTAMCTCQYSLLMVELADSNSRTLPHCKLGKQWTVDSTMGSTIQRTQSQLSREVNSPGRRTRVHRTHTVQGTGYYFHNNTDYCPSMSSLPPHSKPQEAGELKNENERKETNERARGEQRTTAEGVEE